MRTYKYTQIPVISLNAGISGVLDNVVLSIIKRFPPQFFSRIDVKDRNRMRDAFRVYAKDYHTGDDIQLATERKSYPHFMVGYNFNDLKGQLQKIRQDYPGAFINPNFNGYGQIFSDPYGINVFSIDVPMRVELGFKILAATASDQLSIMSYLYNALPWIEGVEFNDVKTDFILPNILVNTVKRLIFKDAPYEAVLPYIVDHFKRFSGGSIVPIYQNGDEKKVFMKLKRNYKSIYFRADDEPTMGDGEKLNKAFTNFDVNFQGRVDINIPISWVLATPDFVAGSEVGDYLITQPPGVGNGEHQAIRLKTFPEAVYTPFTIPTEFEQIHEEEIFMVGAVDRVDLKEYIPSEYLPFFLSHSGMTWRTNFTFHIYEGPYLVDALFIKELPPGKVIEIRGCSMTKPYTVKIYVRKNAYDEFVKENPNVS